MNDIENRLASLQELKGALNSQAVPGSFSVLLAVMVYTQFGPPQFTFPSWLWLVMLGLVAFNFVATFIMRLVVSALVKAAS